MPLFEVSDPVRPAYVVAKDYADAAKKWVAAVKRERGGEDSDPPKRIFLICVDQNLIVGEEFEA